MLTSKALLHFCLFFTFFRKYVFCPHFQTLNTFVSSFFVRSTLCAPHIYSFVPSLSLESRWNPGDHLHWRRRTVFWSIDLRSVVLLRFAIALVFCSICVCSSVLPKVLGRKEISDVSDAATDRCRPRLASSSSSSSPLPSSSLSSKKNVLCFRELGRPYNYQIR